MDNHFMNQKIVDERKKQNLQNKAIYAKNKLKIEVEKRLKTTMIGALASFEEGFGEAIGLNSDNPTEKQERLCDVWEDVRKEILDRGNRQIKIALEEIDCYDVQYGGFKYKFLRREE